MLRSTFRRLSIRTRYVQVEVGTKPSAELEKIPLGPANTLRNRSCNIIAAPTHIEEDVEGHQKITPERRFSARWIRKFGNYGESIVRQRGWRFGLYAGFYTSLTVPISNIILVIVGCFSHGGIKDGIGTLAVGDTKYIFRLGVAYHVLINIISTGLLVSSNYAMQILSAPTREELDAAHQQGKWLDIGLMSIHNLRHIHRRRVVLWSVLAVSSIPFHLL